MQRIDVFKRKYGIGIMLPNSSKIFSEITFKSFNGQVSEVLRDYQYDIRTESAYGRLIRLYIMFQAKRHPDRMGRAEAVAFLSLRSGA